MFKRIAVSLAFTVAVVWAIERGLGYELPQLTPLVVYLGTFALLTALDARRRPAGLEEIEWPVSGPVRRLGPAGVVGLFTFSTMLAFLNPFQLVQIVRQMVGQARIRSRLAKAPLDEGYVNRVEYTLPFDGEWTIINGGVTRETSHSWDVLTQRYAYDFVIADDRRVRHSGRGTTPEDYYCYGKDILAAADGVVVAAVDRIGNAPFLGFGFADIFARDFRGNHVVIQHADEEYGFYAHLVKGSVTVTVGERVTRGQSIGRCGNTGHSSEPHLHFHVQDREDFFTAAGLPIAFTNVTIDGMRSARVQVRGGQRVANG